MRDLFSKKIKTVSDKLIDSEIRYRRLFESAKDGILILDFETGSIVDANPFIVKIMGYPLEEVLGKKLWEIGLFSNKDLSEQAFIELKANNYIRFEDMPILQRNGTITDVEFVSNVYLADNKKVIQCNIRDITERKTAEKALKESDRKLKKQIADYKNLNKKYATLNDELTISLNHIQKINDELIIAKVKAEESDKLKSAFLANISHEIRTPINTIMGFSKLLLDPGLSKEKLEHFVQIINASSQQLMTVINDVIDISIIESGKITIHPELVNVSNLLSELFVIYKKVVEHKKISLHFFYEPSNNKIQVKTDGNRIKQVLCNLLNNAIKFTKEGKIEFGFTIKDNFIEFYVKDNGIGIAPENHELIFQRFRQVESANSEIYGGNGLGLSISKALVEKLGGTIKVNSELGKGSIFSFTIPCTKKIKSAVIPAQNVTPDTYSWKGKTVLLVEDDLGSQIYLEEILSSTDVKLIHACNGKEAIEYVKNNADISLVLMDIKMPVMDGIEATTLIKQVRPNLPVIVQTAFVLSYGKEQTFEAGYDEYFIKPIDGVFFMKAINNHLSKVEITAEK